MTTTILSLYQHRFGSAVRPNGNGFNGPCPLCGGEAGTSDRFMVWPERSDNLGHLCMEQGIKGVWWCRRCNQGGDTIAYLEQCEGMNFKQACAELGISTVRGPVRKRRAPTEPAPTATFTPRAYPLPSSAWQTYATKLVDEASAEIWHQPQALKWLAARGIDADAIRSYRIGYLKGEGLNAGRYRARTALGLAPKVAAERHPACRHDGDTPHSGSEAIAAPMASDSECGTGRTAERHPTVRTKIFIPRGITIPTLQAGAVVNLRIRRHKADLSAHSPKYMELEGSYRGPMLLTSSSPAPLAMYFVTEAELDAMLIHHSTGGVVGALAVRTNRGKPDTLAHPHMAEAVRIGIALDYDPAGTAGVDFWENTYPASRRWPTPVGKDAGDAYALGLNIRDYVATLLPASVQLPPADCRQEAATPRNGSEAIAAPMASDSECGTGRAAERHPDYTPRSGSEAIAAPMASDSECGTGSAAERHLDGHVDAFFAGQNIGGGGGEKTACTILQGQKSALMPTSGQIQSAENTSFTASEIAFLQAALPAYLHYEHVPSDVLRACLLWRGVPATFVHRLQGGGFAWRYSRTWAKNNREIFETFWKFQDESTALWQWLSDHIADEVNCENLLHIWGY